MGRWGGESPGALGRKSSSVASRPSSEEPWVLGVQSTLKWGEGAEAAQRGPPGASGESTNVSGCICQNQIKQQKKAKCFPLVFLLNQLEALHPAALVSRNGHNKAPQTAGLQTTETETLTALETASPKSRCWQARAPYKASRGGPFLLSSDLWSPRAFLGLWLHHSHLCLHLLPFRSMFFLCPNVPFLTRITVIKFRPTSIQSDLLLTNYSCKDPTSNRTSHFEVLVGNEFLEDIILPNTLAIEEMSGIGSRIDWKPPYGSNLWGLRELPLTLEKRILFCSAYTKIKGQIWYVYKVVLLLFMGSHTFTTNLIWRKALY